MFNISPITGTFGATITDVDLSRADQGVAAEVLSTLDKYKVLYFPEPGINRPQDLLRFAEFFGVAEKTLHPTWADHPDAQGVKLITSANFVMGPKAKDSWHTDGPPRKNRHWMSFLQAADVPDFGRDTVFADMGAAFQRLSPIFQEFLVGLTALNDWGVQKPGATQYEHPVVVTNPRTGEKSLYVNRAYTRSIVGLEPQESEALLKLLFDLVNPPELQLRVSWRKGALAIWNNEYTQHYLAKDRTYPRVMHRVMTTPREFANMENEGAERLVA